MKITTDGLFAAIAVLAMALAGAACSGESDTSEQAQASPSRTATSEAPPTQTPATNLTTAEFRVKGMTCGGCAMATEMAVKKLDGVESADAKYLGGEKSGRATVTFDPSAVSTEQIAAAIEKAGYTPTLESADAGS